MSPDAPAAAAPVLRCTAPLAPAVPAAADSMTTLPLDVAVLLPLVSFTLPPTLLAAEVLPAVNVTSPPT